MKLHKPRVMLFAYDGTGLGHLMRLIRIANCLKEDFVPLIVTGHRAVCQIIPSDIEFVRLPVFEQAASRQIGMQGHSLCIKEFRADTIRYIGKLFKPHVLITDYMPAGKKNELLEMIAGSHCLKYLVMRGDIGSDDQLQNVVFSTANNSLIEQFYNRIFIASDPRIEDFTSDASIPVPVRDRFKHVGFVTRTISTAEVENVRAARGLSPSDRWVVCSAGGGRMGESLVHFCLELVGDKRFVGVQFDIVQGYYSELPWPDPIYDTLSLSGNVRITRASNALPLMHAAADCVICSGGYNSLLEAIQGRPKYVLAYSVQVNEKEQTRNILRLGQYYPILMLQNLDNLSEELARSLQVTPKTTPLSLALDGAREIAQTIKEDLYHVEHL